MVEPIYQEDGIILYCGDCRDILPQFPDKSFDSIITDPPYKIIANKRNRGSGFYKDKNHLADIDESFGVNHNPSEFLELFINVCDGNILVWHSKSLLKYHIDFAEAKKRKWDLMFWHKQNAVPAHYQHQLNDTEYCIIMRGGSFNNSLSYDNYHKYFIGNIEHSNGHPTPKPTALMMRQVNVFTLKNETILDPFCGSGTTLVAAKQLGRKAVGIEISEKYCQLTIDRLRQKELF